MHAQREREREKEKEKESEKINFHMDETGLPYVKVRTLPQMPLLLHSRTA